MGLWMNSIKFFAGLVFIALLTTVLTAQEDRVKAELNAKDEKIPLKEALGDASFKMAMNSGRYEYVGNTKCRLCHRKFFLGRKNDPHDFAMDSLRKEGHENNPRCLSCHATGFGVPTGFVSMKETPRLANVQCEGCHGPGNLHVKNSKVKKGGGGFLAGVNRPDRIKKMCKSCHTERWDRAYHDFNSAYDKYRNADPNKKYEKQ